MRKRLGLAGSRDGSATRARASNLRMLGLRGRRCRFLMMMAV